MSIRHDQQQGTGRNITGRITFKIDGTKMNKG